MKPSNINLLLVVGVCLVGLAYNSPLQKSGNSEDIHNTLSELKGLLKKLDAYLALYGDNLEQEGSKTGSYKSWNNHRNSAAVKEAPRDSTSSTEDSSETDNKSLTDFLKDLLQDELKKEGEKVPVEAAPSHVEHDQQQQHANGEDSNDDSGTGNGEDITEESLMNALKYLKSLEHHKRLEARDHDIPFP